MNEDIALIVEDMRDLPEAKCAFGNVREFIEFPELIRIFNIEENYELNDREQKKLNISEIKTPKIEYDNGKFIYGYECWWTPLETVVRTLNRKDQTQEEKRERISFIINAWKRTSNYISNNIKHEISKVIKEVDQI